MGHHQVGVDETHDTGKQHAILIEHRSQRDVAHRADKSGGCHKRGYHGIFQRHQPIRYLLGIRQEEGGPERFGHQHGHKARNGKINEDILSGHLPVVDKLMTNQLPSFFAGDALFPVEIFGQPIVILFHFFKGR